MHPEGRAVHAETEVARVVVVAEMCAEEEARND